MLVCEFYEVMLVLRVYSVFPFFGMAGAASTNTFANRLSNQKVIGIRRDASAHCFRGFGTTILIVLAGCLALFMSGCGSGVIMSVGGGLAVSPGTVNFGSVPVGHEAQSSITVSNNGSAAVSVSAVSVSGQMFSVSGTGKGPITIPAGGSYPVKVDFTPVSPGSFSGQLTVVDASSQPVVQVSMQGQGSSQGTSQLTVSAASLSFGSVAINTATTQSLTLTSTGTLPVTVDSAAITGTGFTTVGGGLPVTLNPGQSSILQVRFNPIAAGPASGQITISSNASTASTTLVALAGTGTTSVNPTASPQLTVSAASLSFGNVTVGAATTQSLTLASTGTAPVTVDSTAISGAGFAIVGGSLPVTLNPTQSMTLLVQFKPTATGTAKGQITVNSNWLNGATAVVVLNGTSTPATPALSPQMTLSAAGLSFGSVTIDTVTTQPLTLTSTGTAPVTINSAVITGAGFTIVGGNLPATLNPMQSMTLQVQFKPTATGTTSGQITIDSNSSSGSTSVVALSGVGSAAPSPQLTLSVARLNFGDVTVNAATTQSLTLTSTGTSPVTINSVAITGAGFAILDGHWPTTLNPTESMTVRVQFDPTTTGVANGQIAISSNSSTGSTAIVTTSGTSTAAASPQLAVSAGSLSFGSVTVNTATTQPLTLTSTGTAPVTVNSAAIAGAGFAIVGRSFPITLDPLQSITLQVQFLPEATGAASGQITISSNSSSGSMTGVALSGTSAAAASPQLAVSAGSLSFGSVTVNTATTQSLTLTSTGTAPVAVKAPAIVGAGFTIVGGGDATTLNPGQSTTLQVQFDPAASGAASGQITISSNSATGSTTVIMLNGTSIAAANPQLKVSSGSLSFGNVIVGTSSTQSLTLTSSGTAPVTINSAAITGSGFTIVGGNLPVTLSPTQSVTLQVQFDPTAIGVASGQITISSNSSSGTTTMVTLSGTSTAAASPQLTVSAASLSFGNVTVGTATTLPLTLTSTGTSPVTVNSAAISGSGFTIVAQSFPVTLSPTQSVTLQVQFDPTATGAAAGRITISSNSATGGTQSVILSGMGNAANPNLTISNTNVSFGSIAINTTTTKSLTLTSTGTTPVTVNSAAITGAGFTVVGGSFPVTLNPAQTLTLQLQFEPTTAGALSGQIMISSNSISGGGTAVVSLTGTGIAVAHEVDLSWNAPTSSTDPVVGYNIYRSTAGGSFVLLNSLPDSMIVYVDHSVVSGGSYSYTVKSVDSAGVESVASNSTTATIP